MQHPCASLAKRIYPLIIPAPYLGLGDQLGHGNLPWPLIYMIEEEQVGVWPCHVPEFFYIIHPVLI